MHSYSINESRINVFKNIGFLSIVVATIVIKLLNGILGAINNLPYINYFPSITEISIFGVLFLGIYYLFEKKLWKMSPFGVKLSNIPNLNGTWEGKIESSHNAGQELDVKVTIDQTGFEIHNNPNLNGTWSGKIKSGHDKGHEIDVKVTIEQTWSNMSIVLNTAHSKSKSSFAGISMSEKRLVYHYFNEPLSRSPKTMYKHYGVACLDYDEDGTLHGSYFNDWDRGTCGDITLKKIVN